MDAGGCGSRAGLAAAADGENCEERPLPPPPEAAEADAATQATTPRPPSGGALEKGVPSRVVERHTGTVVNKPA